MGLCASVCLWVHLLTLSNINISETSWLIEIKFHLKHHWDREMAAYGFGIHKTSSLISMATDSSHRVIMGETLVCTLAPPFLIGSSSFLQITSTTIKSLMGLKFSKSQLMDYGGSYHVICEIYPHTKVHVISLITLILSTSEKFHTLSLFLGGSFALGLDCTASTISSSSNASRTVSRSYFRLLIAYFKVFHIYQGLSRVSNGFVSRIHLYIIESHHAVA